MVTVDDNHRPTCCSIISSFSRRPANAMVTNWIELAAVKVIDSIVVLFKGFAPDRQGKIII